MPYVINPEGGGLEWSNALEAPTDAQQQDILKWYQDQGFDAFLSRIGQQYDTYKMGSGALYNAGNGVMAYVNDQDPRFTPAPQQNSGFSNFAMGPIGTTLTHFQDVRNAYKENPERFLFGGGFADSPLGTKGINALFGTDYQPLVNQTGGPTSQTYNNAAAQGYETGPTQVGHQLAPAIVGIGAASALAGGGGSIPLGAEEGALAAAGQGSAGAGTVAGTSEASTLAGGTGSDTLAGNTMGEDLLFDPSYYDAGNVNYFQNGADPYGTGVDIYGNPTGEYAPSTFGGDTANTGFGEGGGSGGYSWEDLYKLGQQGYGYAQQAKGIYDKYKGLFGAAAGGVAGALGTPKQSGVTTTTEDIPDWLKGPAQLGVSGLANAYAANPTGQTPLLQGGSKYLTDVINGQYLNNNPYLDQMYDRAAGKVAAGVNALFSKGGRYGSGAHQGVLGETLGNLATDIYAGNYAKERTNQQAVGMQSPQLSSSILSSGFVPAQNLLTGIGAVRSRNISTPYYDSTLNNIISGALGGKQLFG